MQLSKSAWEAATDQPQQQLVCTCGLASSLGHLQLLLQRLHASSSAVLCCSCLCIQLLGLQRWLVCAA